MKNSVKRLLLLAVSVIALALVVAPVSFAGEDDPGPTQAGETQAPQQGANTLAEQQGPAAVEDNSDSSGNSGTSTQVLGATETSSNTFSKTTATKDVVQAKGGIQAGFGGMATQPSNSTTIAGLIGVLFAVAAASVLIPFRRSQD